MRPSSAKRLWLSSTLLLATSALGTLDGTARLESRVSDTLSDRQRAEGELKWAHSDWKSVASVRLQADRGFETREVSPRDIYVQYQSDPLWLRVGNQQVVWGEAFGPYSADIVNPKDLRELGLGGIEENRIPTPIVNAKLLLGDYSAQWIYLPHPFFTKLPAAGSEFAGRLPPISSPTPDFALSNSEVGARVTALVRGVDLSLFHLYAFDRLPPFSRRHTSGASATADIDGMVLRLESLYAFDREVGAVVGLDYTEVEKWRFGLQLASVHAVGDLPTVFGDRDRPLASLQANGTFWEDHSLDVVVSMALRDGSLLGEGRYTWPLSSQLELIFGVDIFGGDLSTHFGQFQRASRGYLLLRATL